MPRTTPVISNYEVPFGLGCKFCKFESQCKDPKQATIAVACFNSKFKLGLFPNERQGNDDHSTG